MASYSHSISPPTLDSPILDLTNMGPPAIKTHIHRYVAQIRLRERNETLLVNFLQTIGTDANPGTDVYTVNNMIVRSKRVDRTVLYELRCQIHQYCMGVRDLATALRVVDAGLADDYKHALNQRVKRVMRQLELENDAYSTIEGFSARTSAEFVWKNQWLMHNYAQKFPDFAGVVDRPSGRHDPSQLL
ncbi:hypothetical protein BGX33_008367 [Mortierella sp. NVP41]|nr:hypothetical protein BGX33_008367 [Mortierella sp. NVP41]